MRDAGVTAMNRVFRKATMGGDLFRQWLYPNLPDGYETNATAICIAERGAAAGETADKIEAKIVAAYEADEVLRDKGEPRQ